MQFSVLALSALLGLASAQVNVTVVKVATANNTLIYSPNNIKVEVGDMVQFQFEAGNHTVTQSTFDAPCQPISAHTNNTGFHSGFIPVAASSGNIPTYTIQINNTNPLWVYCAQGKHCQAGMSMVINENTAANASRSLAKYQAAAVKATTLVPGSSTSGGSASTTTTSGSTTSSTSATTVSGGSLANVPHIAISLLAVAGSFFML